MKGLRLGPFLQGWCFKAGFDVLLNDANTSFLVIAMRIFLLVEVHLSSCPYLSHEKSIGRFTMD